MDHATTSKSKQDELLEAARAKAQDAGRSLTRLRAAVLAAVAESSRPVSAYELAHQLNIEGTRVTTVTVYRSLEFLIELGLVHRLATQSAYIPLRTEPAENEAMLYLICRHCGSVGEMTLRQAGQALNGELSSGFRPASRFIEIEGDCGECTHHLSLRSGV